MFYKIYFMNFVTWIACSTWVTSSSILAILGASRRRVLLENVTKTDELASNPREIIQ